MPGRKYSVEQPIPKLSRIMLASPEIAFIGSVFMLAVSAILVAIGFAIVI
jgi:hypothetical protein